NNASQSWQATLMIVRRSTANALLSHVSSLSTLCDRALSAVSGRSSHGRDARIPKCSQPTATDHLGGKICRRGWRMRAAKTRIPDLRWNCILERSATLVASSCNFGHSELVRCSKIRIGENIFMAWGSLSGLGKFASESWESELQVHGWEEIREIDPAYDSGIGHATQMMWANTSRIGCGMAACENNRVMVVCHYHSAGNFIGQRAYDAVDDFEDNPEDREDFARSLI
ncbi:hypothetical protein PRIPAC_94158, partial [Pristionchus pacificus]